jgi:hypothetical protein
VQNDKVAQFVANAQASWILIIRCVSFKHQTILAGGHRVGNEKEEIDGLALIPPETGSRVPRQEGTQIDSPGLQEWGIIPSYQLFIKTS